MGRLRWMEGGVAGYYTVAWNPIVKAPSKTKSITAAPIPQDVAMAVFFCTL